jgi:hypothetical protein
VPKVGSQFHTLDLLDVLGRSREKFIRHSLQRAVIDEDDPSGQPVLAEDGIEPLDQKPCRRPIVEDRHQYRQWKQREKFCVGITASWM